MFTLITDHKSPSKNHGFALVIALSLMAFVLLLLLSITTLVQVESGVASTSKRTLEARMNAQLGLQIALGELQRTLGPDARVSANASILDSDPSTLEIEGVQHPRWLGAYPAIDPDNPDASLLSPKALRDWSLAEMEWLVSNNTLVGQPDPTTNLSGAVVTLGQFITDPTVVIPEDVDGLDANLLTKAQAGKVEIAEQSGHYAWLVSDESMKARVDSQASMDGSDVLDGTLVDLEAQARSNYQVTQGTDFSSLLPSYNDAPEQLSKVMNHDGLELLGAASSDSSWKNWGKLNQDKFTPYACSLPVNVVDARLKQDLTAYFKGSYTGLDNQSMLDPRFGITAERTPTFNLLKQWATMVDDHTVAQDVVAPDNRVANPQHGLHPVITQGAVAMKHSYRVLSSDTFNPVYIFMPQIQLMNPYNVPLKAQDYIVQVGYQFKWGMQVTGTRGTNKATYDGGQPEFRSWQVYNGQQPLPEHKIADNEEIQYQGNKRFFTFVIKDQAFEPGESLIFYSKPPSSGAISGVEYNMNSDADTDILNNYANDEDLNLLFNEASLDESFFYVVSPLIGTFDMTDPKNAGMDLSTSIKSESNFQSRSNESGAINEEDLDMHLNLYAFQDGKPLLLHAITKAQQNNRYGNWQRPTYPLDEYQRGEHFDTDTTTFFADKNPLINLGSSMLVSDFDIFTGGSGNTPPNAGQPHAVLAYWNIRNQVSFSTSDDWTPGSMESTEWLNTFSFRDTSDFLTTWESTDNLYGNLSTDRVGGWHQSQIQGTVYPLFDFPTSPFGPASLGSFQHANLSVYGWQPTYAFGNAQAPPRFDRSLFRDPANADLYDISYLLNASTWDRFYLSTIPQFGVALDRGYRLPNSRLYLTSIDGESNLDASRLIHDDGFALSASSVLIHGGFNVNSTSLTAWKAFLSGALGQSVETIYSGNESNSDTAAAMGRFLAPLLEEPDAVAADRNTTDFETPYGWAATRTLNADEINTLARRIVEEVKRRGPFLSLADFVNRRLEPDADVTGDERVYQEVLGTLQAAINKATVEDQAINYHYYDNESAGTKMTIKPSEDWSNGTMNFNVTAEAQESMLGAPSSKISSEGGLIHSYAPNYLSQADVLTKIGPSVTVRGDTFVIRSYGDSVDSLTGDIRAKAWCEAVVQRFAKPVNWDGSDSRLVQPQAPDETGFGRGFKIVSFRWLDPTEVTPYSNDDAIIN